MELLNDSVFSTPGWGAVVMVARVTTPDEKLAELLAWNIPPIIRDSKLGRGENCTCSNGTALPTASPTHAPVATGASK